MSIISESEDIATMTANHYERILRERNEAREDAAQLADQLSGLELRTTEELARLEQERDEARVLLASEKITREYVIKRGIDMKKERDEAREQNAKLRDIAERAIEKIEQENWGIRQVSEFWKQIRSELDQLKEGAK